MKLPSERKYNVNIANIKLFREKKLKKYKKEAIFLKKEVFCP